MRTVLVILCVVLLAGCSKPRWSGNATDFAMTTFAGKSTMLSSLAGKPIVLNFWADW